MKNKLKKLGCIVSESYKILNKIKFDLVNICVDTEYHDKCFEYLNSTNALIIVEKPIISLKKFSNNFIKFLKTPLQTCLSAGAKPPVSYHSSK